MIDLTEQEIQFIKTELNIILTEERSAFVKTLANNILKKINEEEN